jgi:hypothetical protein
MLKFYPFSSFLENLAKTLTQICRPQTWPLLCYTAGQSVSWQYCSHSAFHSLILVAVDSVIYALSHLYLCCWLYQIINGTVGYLLDKYTPPHQCAVWLELVFSPDGKYLWSFLQCFIPRYLWVVTYFFCLSLKTTPEHEFKITLK